MSLLSYIHSYIHDIIYIMSVADLLFTLQVIFAAIGVQPQTFKCEANSCAGHAGDTLKIDPSTSVTLWIAPDDEIVSRVPDQSPVACPDSNLRATVSRALRLSARRVVLRPMCLEGLMLQKTRNFVLVDPQGPTYCALIVSSAKRLLIRDITFDNGECINATASVTYVPTADRTAAVVLRPRSSRLDSETSLQNLTFATTPASVAVLLSPPSWGETLRLNGPTFTGLRANVKGTRFVALLVTGRLILKDFDEVSAVVLRDPVAGLDRPSVGTTATAITTDLWQYLDNRVLMRLRRASNDALPTPTNCCSPSPSCTPNSTTLVAVAFSLVAILVVCVILLLVHSCRSPEAEDLAPYRVQGAPGSLRVPHTGPTS